MVNYQLSNGANMSTESIISSISSGRRLFTSPDTRGGRRIFVRICMLIVVAQWAAGDGQNAFVDPSQAKARIRYAVLDKQIVFRLQADSSLISGNKSYPLEPGEYTLEAMDIHPATRRYHVFPKTFPPTEKAALEAYLAEWRARDYTPEVVTLGLLYRTASGALLDNRQFWVSLARFNNESGAKSLVEKLKKESVWAWIRPETASPGTARFSLHGKRGKAAAAFSAPLDIESSEPIEISDVASSYWKERKANRLFEGPLRMEIGPGGGIEVFGSLPVETYLRGVVPAEMPSKWPGEALKAQALVARSEIYASLAMKYKLEGFDFTALESCRAYWGVGGHQPSTDAAVQATAGQALVVGDKYAATVFSACCGGWTENNDTVWSGPPDPVLRGTSDLRDGKKGQAGIPSMQAWLTGGQRAWCADDEEGFRWQRRFSNAELSAMMDKKYKTGTITDIVEGSRGVSGRLKSVTITGTTGKVTLERELAIRQAFGGLPSAMIIIRPSPETGAPKSWVVDGGGRGHGVGLCQQGARGMAAAGLGYEEIVAHYFPNAAIERTR